MSTFSYLLKDNFKSLFDFRIFYCRYEFIVSNCTESIITTIISIQEFVIIFWRNVVCYHRMILLNDDIEFN